MRSGLLVEIKYPMNRCETGNKVIYMNGASKEMEAALKRGGVVATLLDQKVPSP